MSTLTTRATLSMTQQFFRSLNLELPAGLVDDLAKLDAAANKSTVGAAVLDSLMEGNDPATDGTVLRVLAQQQLATAGSHLLGDAVEVRRATILATHAPAIIDALVPVVAEADKALTAAREQIGDQLNLTDEAVTQLRPAQMPAWGAAREHAHRADLAAQCWQTVVIGTRQANIDADKRPLILADLDVEQLDLLGYRPKPRVVISSGHRLSLATIPEFVARCRRVNQQKTAVKPAGELAKAS